jgi:hypothetical protein
MCACTTVVVNSEVVGLIGFCNRYLSEAVHEIPIYSVVFSEYYMN